MHFFASLRQRFGQFLGRSDSTGQIVRVVDGCLHIRVICNNRARPLKLKCALDGFVFYRDTISQQQCADDALEVKIPLPVIPPDADNITVRIGRFVLEHLAGSPWHLSQKPLNVSYALLHIPKTAGTSLRVAIEGALGSASVFPNTRYIQLRGGKYLKQNEMASAMSGASPAVSLIQGHFSLRGLKELVPDARLVTVLRNPLSRVTSLLKHMRARHGATQSYEDMLSVSSASGGAPANTQTRLLSLLELRAPISEHLDSAKEQLETFSVVGLTERYHETLVLCEAILGLSLGPPKYLNLSELPGEEWSFELLEKIEDLNWYDAELYRYAEKIFERQLQRVTIDI